MPLPSVNTLCQIKDVSPEIARRIRAIMAGPGYVHTDPAKSCDRAWGFKYCAGCQSRIDRIDRQLGTFGVEYVRRGHNRRSPGFYYCNTGDTYAATILKVGDRFRVGSWGDIVERGHYD